MFFKFLKRQSLKILLLTLFIIPNIASAYSEYIIASGQSVGMKLDTNGIIIVGSYEINGHNSIVEAGLKPGDIIYQINSNSVNSIEEMVNIIDTCNCNSLNIKYTRDNKHTRDKTNKHF